jgi:hypothetical protein
MKSVDTDLDGMSREQLVEEVKKLRRGIRDHPDASRHELCWHHPALGGLLPKKTDPIPTVPEWPQSLRSCILYRQSLDEQAPDAPRSRQDLEEEWCALGVPVRRRDPVSRGYFGRRLESSLDFTDLAPSLHDKPVGRRSVPFTGDRGITGAVDLIAPADGLALIIEVGVHIVEVRPTAPIGLYRRGGDQKTRAARTRAAKNRR